MTTINEKRTEFTNYQSKVAEYQNNYADILSFRIGYWLNYQGVRRDDILSLDGEKIRDYNPETLFFAGYVSSGGETYRTVYTLTKEEAYRRVQDNLKHVVYVFGALNRTDLQELLMGGYYQYIDSIVLLNTYNKLTTEDISYFMK